MFEWSFRQRVELVVARSDEVRVDGHHEQGEGHDGDGDVDEEILARLLDDGQNDRHDRQPNHRLEHQPKQKVFDERLWIMNTAGVRQSRMAGLNAMAINHSEQRKQNERRIRRQFSSTRREPEQRGRA